MGVSSPAWLTHAFGRTACGPAHGLSWAGECGFAGHAVNPSMGACRKHPCFLQSRKPAPADPRRCVGGHGKVNGGADQFHAFPDVGAFRVFVREPNLPATPRRDTPRVSDFAIRPRPSMEGGRRAAPGGTVKNMGSAHAPDGLGRTPNPGLAVYAGLRTRASFCQAYKDVLAACPVRGCPTASQHVVRETLPLPLLQSSAARNAATVAASVCVQSLSRPRRSALR